MADIPDTLRSWSATAGSNSPTGGTSIGTNLDDNLREIQAVVRGYLAGARADMASASTVDLSTATSNYVRITGTTTITSFGTESAGIQILLLFGASLVLTHNSTSLILPGTANITTAIGDMALMLSEGSGNWRCVYFSPASGTSVVTSPVDTIWIPASAMLSRTTNGAASGSTEMGTNKNMVVTLDFDASTQEFAQFQIAMPKSWNESTVTFVPYWSHAATTTNFGVVWSCAGVATGDDDALDVAFGTEQTSTDTGGTTNDLYIGPESSAITIGGTPAENDYVTFQVARVPSNGSDTMAIDARLHGIKIKFTRNAWTDA